MRMWRETYPGLVWVAAFGILATVLAQAGLAKHGLSALTLAIILGVVFGNCFPMFFAQTKYEVGVQLAQKRFLRIGVALYGFNLSAQQIVQLGVSGLGVDVLMVCSTLGLGWVVGRYVLGMDRETTLLTAAGSAICGAAAVVATVPVLDDKDKPVAGKAAAAVATVVLFGTLAMLVYPLLYAWLGGNRVDFGIYVGSTVHEVAQVVAIGSIIGDDTAHAAVIAKMIRVMLLVPFLLASSALFRSREAKGRAISIPWFAVMFVVFAGMNSTSLIPMPVVAGLRQLGTWLLTGAMAALGLKTTLAQIRSGGLRPFLLGFFLFCHLVIVGRLINNWLV
ncbi:YeiH family protein [Uliginosibacterium gangwonense]|uniref:YeiH family protein n=1 Tax=Uliginosibacterium gangwonense TaxID=392736 RepID=UPI0003A6F2CF|nr:YeiH family protein [Uliginosibacterium gangwonense]